MLEVVEVKRKQIVTSAEAAEFQTFKATAWNSLCISLKTQDFHEFQSFNPYRGSCALKVAALPLRATMPCNRAVEMTAPPLNGTTSMIYGYIEKLKSDARHSDPEIRVAANEGLASIQRLGLREIWDKLTEELRLDREAADVPAPAAHAMALAFAKVPAIGTAVLWRGQPFTCVAVEPYTRTDGVASQVLTWEAPCWTCGEPFLETAALGGKKAVNRRCRKHKRSGSRVKGVCHPPMRELPMKKAA